MNGVWPSQNRQFELPLSRKLSLGYSNGASSTPYGLAVALQIAAQSSVVYRIYLPGRAIKDCQDTTRESRAAPRKHMLASRAGPAPSLLMSHAVIRKPATSMASCGRCENFVTFVRRWWRCLGANASVGIRTLQDEAREPWLAARQQLLLHVPSRCTCRRGKGRGGPSCPPPRSHGRRFSPPKTDIKRQLGFVVWCGVVQPVMSCPCSEACSFGAALAQLWRSFGAGTVRYGRSGANGSRMVPDLPTLGLQLAVISRCCSWPQPPPQLSPPPIFTGPSATTLRLFLISAGDKLKYLYHCRPPLPL